MTSIWCMVPEIWSTANMIFCHFGLFFAPLPPYGPRISKFWKNEKNAWKYYHFGYVYHTWQSYYAWFLRQGAWWTEFFVILDSFFVLLPPPLTTWKIKLLKKWKNTWDIIILHMCTINEKHIMYGSWDMEHDGHNFLSFWTIFCPFTPLTTRKVKILKKGEKPWRYYHFTNVYDKLQSNDQWFLRYGVQWTEFFIILDPFLHFYPPNNLNKSNLKKMQNTLGDIIILRMCIINE